MIKIITIITKFIVATLIALIFSSCNRSFNIGFDVKGSGNITTETRLENQNFKSIDVGQGIEVNLEQTNTTSISVVVDDNLQNHIITKIENGVLIIKSDISYNATETPIVNIKMPIVSQLTASSGSEINSIGTLISNAMLAKSSSGSSINIEVEADAITLESSSGSTIVVSGKALKLETISSSGSSIDAKGLQSNQVLAQATSGSSTSTYPILSLNAKASSGSSIDYYKVPKKIVKEESSGGSIDSK
jgi:hypothetical protein